MVKVEQLRQKDHAIYPKLINLLSFGIEAKWYRHARSVRAVRQPYQSATVVTPKARGGGQHISTLQLNDSRHTSSFLFSPYLGLATTTVMANSPQISPLTTFRAQNSGAADVLPKKVEYGPVQTTPAAVVPPPDTLDSPASSTRDNSHRTRHSSACFPCAKRKVKCDRDIQNPCSNCSKRGLPEGCLVKTPKDRLSQSLSEHSSRDLGAETHRDKRTRYDGYQVAFQAGPSTVESPSPQLLANSHVASIASRTQPYADDQPPVAKHSASLASNSSRKSKETLQWDAVEPLLPPRKDLLKYGLLAILIFASSMLIGSLDISVLTGSDRTSSIR